MRDEPFTLFAGLPVGFRTLAGIDEKLTQVGETEGRETWNGRTIVLTPSFKRKWSVSLSNTGDQKWVPDVDLFEPGSQVTLHALTQWTVRLTPGDTDAVLLRDPVPGSVHARDAIDEAFVVPHGLTGRTVTIFARARHTRVSYRPILHCVVVSMEMGSSGRSQDWSMELREEFAP